jgi:hypothetical protein
LNISKEINNRDLFIECIGLPGAGKTAIMINFGNNIKNDFNVYIKSRGEADLLYKSRKSFFFKNLEIFIFLVFNPNLFFTFVKSILQLKLVKKRIGTSMLILEAFVSLKTFKRTSKPLNKHLIDEGILQYIGSLVVPLKSKNDFIPDELISKSISHAVDGIIFIKTPISVSINRVKDRNSGKSRFDFMEDSEARRNLTIMNEVFSHCVSIAKKKNIPVLELNAEDAINDKVHEINKWVTLFFL